MKVVAFAASTSKQSINKKLVTYAANLVPQAQVEVLDLNDYSLPLFSVDLESELGESPQNAVAFYQKLSEADAILVSFAEHNGAYSAVFKNLLDWMTRIDRKVFHGKPTLLLATSPGAGGAKNVLALAESSMPHFGAEVKGTLSIPSFNKAFDATRGELIDENLKARLSELLVTLLR